MPDLRIHTIEQDGDNSREYPAMLRQHLPSGQGYVEVKPNGDIVLSVPAGGGSGSGETYYTEEVTVTTLNQLPNTSLTPKYSSQDFKIITAWGDVYKVETGAYTVNTATKALAIVSSQFAFQVGWKLFYKYAVDPNAGVPMLPFPSTPDNRFATSNTATLANGVTYTIRASNTASGVAWNAFNSENIFDTSFWFAGVFAIGNEQWLEIEFSQNVIIGSIDITPLPSLEPEDFRFQVANTHDANGAGYTQVFTRIGETWSGFSGETKNFVIPSPQAAKIIRIAITKTRTTGNAPGFYTIVLKP